MLVSWMVRFVVFSDTHDHIANICKFFEKLRALKPDFVVFCGDIVSPFAAVAITRGLKELGLKCYGVLGNNEGDVFTILKKIDQSVFMLETFRRTLLLDKLTAVVWHGIGGESETLSVVRGLALSAAADVTLYGHTHKARYIEVDRQKKDVREVDVLAELRKSEEYRVSADLAKVTVALNPGELCGWLTGIASFAAVELSDTKLTVRFIRL